MSGLIRDLTVRPLEIRLGRWAVYPFEYRGRVEVEGGPDGLGLKMRVVGALQKVPAPWPRLLGWYLLGVACWRLQAWRARRQERAT